MNMVNEVNNKAYFKNIKPYFGSLGSTGRSWETVAEFHPFLAPQTIRNKKLSYAFVLII
jgi:hypothetical protein